MRANGGSAPMNSRCNVSRKGREEMKRVEVLDGSSGVVVVASKYRLGWLDMVGMGED